MNEMQGEDGTSCRSKNTPLDRGSSVHVSLGPGSHVGRSCSPPGLRKGKSAHPQNSCLYYVRHSGCRECVERKVCIRMAEFAHRHCIVSEANKSISLPASTRFSNTHRTYNVLVSKLFILANSCSMCCGKLGSRECCIKMARIASVGVDNGR